MQVNNGANNSECDGRMSVWKECKLSEVINLIGGGTPKTSIPDYWDGNIPWLSVVDFNTGNKFVYETEKTITQKGLENSSTKMLDTNDVIISARGTVGAIAVLKRPMAFNQSCYGIRNVQNKSVQEYLYYLTKDAISNLQQMAHGGVFDTITRETFSAIDIKIPPLPEQRAIASVLSSLDDKIDLLHRQNKTLEAMAETLFRQWFVEEAEDTTTTLNEFADNIRINAKVQDLKKYVHYVGLEHIPRKQIALSDWGSTAILESNKSVFEKGDILFGKLRSYFHKVVFAPIAGVCSTDILVIRPKNPDWFSYCLFWFFNKDVVEHSDLGSGGTRMPRTNWEIIAHFRIPKPDLKLIVEFERIVKPMINKISANVESIHTLEKLRDSILPKLMSGEVRVTI
jgi:type I restriction enzyme S subunit